MPSTLLIKDAVLALPSGPMRSDILCEGHRVVAIGRDLVSDGANVIRANGLTAGPGFIDIHVHGGGGWSFFTRDPGEIRAYRGWAPSRGVTAFLVSTVGPNADTTLEMLGALAQAIGTGSGAEAMGFHLEGPFLNPLRRGAFHPDMLREAVREEFLSYQAAAGGAIRQATFAPELSGGLALCAAIASTAVPAIGHTDATIAEARAAFEMGARHVTHLFNAMRPLHQREGGLIVAALLQDDVTCELVCDAKHVQPDVLRFAYRMLGPNRMVCVTDNLHMAGTGELTGRFGDQDVEISGPAAVRPDGTIVGSIATMDEQFRNVVQILDVDLPTAFRICATNPARVIGEGKRKGVLERGYDADIVLLDGDLQVVTTICRGEIAYCTDGARLS
ncbi:MAG: N-acetylglucosamine-6-phosphate deacetylase [Dehalococcoidia bacterium]|nr:N-acetylglucosamine-6-phosphate deacetylase [Dehalococcoidia bacterium]